MVESFRISSFLLSARAVQILAQFDMTNRPHRLPDSNTQPARLIHWAGTEEQGVGWGVAKRKEGNRDVESKTKNENAVQMTDLPGIYGVCNPQYTNVTSPCYICDDMHLFQKNIWHFGMSFFASALIF